MLRHRPVVAVDAFLGRLVVVGRDQQRAFGARLLRRPGEVHGLAGGVGAGPGNDGDPAPCRTHHRVDDRVVLGVVQGGRLSGGAARDQRVGALLDLELHQRLQGGVVHPPVLEGRHHGRHRSRKHFVTPLGFSSCAVVRMPAWCLYHPGGWGAGGFQTRPYIGPSSVPSLGAGSNPPLHGLLRGLSRYLGAAGFKPAPTSDRLACYVACAIQVLGRGRVSNPPLHHRGLCHPGAWARAGLKPAPTSVRPGRVPVPSRCLGAGGFETRPYIGSSRLPDLRQTRTLPWKTSCAGPVM